MGYFASVTCLLSDPRKENVQNKHLSVNFLSYFVYQKNVTLFKCRKYFKKYKKKSHFKSLMVKFHDGIKNERFNFFLN